MQRSIIFSALTALFLLSGCGGSSSDADCRFSTQTDLDKGNFEAVIGRLSSPNSSCRSAYSNNEWQVDLAAAYMGHAGVTVSTVLDSIGSGDASFESFVDGIASSNSSTSLEDLDNATALYQAVIDGNVSSAFASPSRAGNYVGSNQEAALFAGLANLAKTAVGISGLVDDFDALNDDTNPNNLTEKLKLRAAGCALQFAGKSGEVCGDASSITSSPVTFTYADNSTRDFDLIDVELNANAGTTYHYLGLGTSTIALRGTCSNDFSAGTLPCPRNRDGSKEDKLISDIVVTSLNKSFDLILGAISDENKRSDVTQYRGEIDGNGNGTITLDEITTYLNNKSK